MDIPVYVTVSVIAVGIFAVIGVPLVLARATRGAESPRSIPAILGIVLGVWFIAALTLAIKGTFQPQGDQGPPPPGIALFLALIGLALAFRSFAGFRASLENPRAQPGLLSLQVWRIEGLVFLVLMAHGLLPALFAVPAGLGDLAIGLSAPIMARNLHRRHLAIAWNLFGLLDLAVAVFLGVATGPGALRLFYTIPTSEVVTAFPVVLIPVFLVPLSIGLHFVSLRSLRSSAVPLTLAPAMRGS